MKRLIARCLFDTSAPGVLWRQVDELFLEACHLRARTAGSEEEVEAAAHTGRLEGEEEEGRPSRAGAGRRAGGRGDCKRAPCSCSRAASHRSAASETSNEHRSSISDVLEVSASARRFASTCFEICFLHLSLHASEVLPCTSSFLIGVRRSRCAKSSRSSRKVQSAFFLPRLSGSDCNASSTCHRCDFVFHG